MNITSSNPFLQGGTCRWISPELFEPEKFGLKESRPTKYSDRYALGMVVYEVLSERVPFSRYHGYVVVPRILKGERPGRPRGAEGTWFTDEVWSTLERCWKPVPGDRPRIRDVLQCLENASRSWIPPSSQTVVGAPATYPLARIFGSRTEESTDESEISSHPLVVSSHSSRKHQKGNPSEKNV